MNLRFRFLCAGNAETPKFELKVTKSWEKHETQKIHEKLDLNSSKFEKASQDLKQIANKPIIYLKELKSNY